MNAHFGGRFSANLGIPLVRESGLGMQIGSAISATDAAVGVLEVIDGTDSRFQSFTTVGFFQRAKSGHHWALAWDLLHQSYYDDITLQQLRGRVGWQRTATTQIGLWGTWSAGSSQQAQVAGVNVQLSPIDQLAIFFNQTWQTGINTECWAGLADGHGKVVHVFPGNDRIEPAPLFGASFNAPLNDRIALYGRGNFILPADSGTVDAYLGFVYRLGRSSRSAGGNRFAPPLERSRQPDLLSRPANAKAK